MSAAKKKVRNWKKPNYYMFWSLKKKGCPICRKYGRLNWCSITDHFSFEDVKEKYCLKRETVCTTVNTDDKITGRLKTSDGKVFEVPRCHFKYTVFC